MDQVSDDTYKPGTYVVITSSPAFNDSDKSWIVGTSQIVATKDTALEIAQDNVKNTSESNTQYAYVVGSVLACFYTGKISDSPVMAMASVNKLGVPSFANFHF